MNKYHIITIGCQMNKADAERLSAYLESLGFGPVDKPTKADLVALVTCGVRQSAEDRIYGLVHQLKKDRPQSKIILTGCLSDRPDVQKRLGEKIDVYFNITELPHLAAKLGLAFDNGSNEGYLNLHAKYQSAFSAYVPIGNGCNNFCAYCVVPYARGREIYRPHEEILAEVKRLIAKGYKEIILIAQNVNSYYSPLERGGRRPGCVDFADLITMIDKLAGDFWIRFATSHPKDLSDKLIATVAESKKVCPHWHIALQSGSDTILKIMNRQYTAAHFLNLVKKIRQVMPDASITTDIIVGFPSETEEQFLATKEVMAEVGFAQAYISRYSPRFGTASAKLADDVAPAVKQARERALEEVLRAGAKPFNEQFIGQTRPILVEQADGQNYYGKNSRFTTVRFTSKINYAVGEFAPVKIIEANYFSLNGVALHTPA